MIAIDTNILLRYVVQDDPQASGQATDLIRQTLARQENIFICTLVLVESVWVLRRVYKFSKPHLLTFIETLLAEPGFEVEDSRLAHQAMTQFRQGEADFSDYLIGQTAKHRSCSTTYTFDQGLKKSSAFTLLN
ncbi:MAG: type II toxin-antitoxin system VapC family toxin [Verrucomicrobiae bacterium]|nr:type II toxin-antitoxin system VapC family toxin [Verrucomicrobiae bacterium]